MFPRSPAYVRSETTLCRSDRYVIAVVACSVHRLELAAVTLAAMTATIHLSLGASGFVEYVATGDRPGVLAPLFVLTGVVIVAGIVAGMVGTIGRRRLYTAGLLLMIVHLVAYVDWHALAVFERFVDLGERAHAHEHASTDRDLAAAVDSLEAGSYRVETLVDVATSLSIVVATIAHAVAAPIDLVTKTAEVLLVGALFVLRWADRTGVDTVRWEQAAVRGPRLLAVGITGIATWTLVILLGTGLVDRGVDVLFVHLLELTAFVFLVGMVGWYLIGEPIVSSSGDPDSAGSPPSVGRLVPGIRPGDCKTNAAVWGVYFVAFLVLTAAFVGVVPTDGDAHGDHGSHDHSSVELDLLVGIVDGQDVEVDRERTMVHYADYYDGEALMLTVVSDSGDERETIETEIETIVAAYVTLVDDGGFDDVVVVLGETRTVLDDSTIWWEIEQEWVDHYLDGAWTWEQLMAAVLDTYEERT